MTARPFRAAALVALSLAALGTTACVRGRNDGGKDVAGGSNNGAGPAPQPGPLAGTNTDTSSIAPAAASAPATAPAAATKKAP